VSTKAPPTKRIWQHHTLTNALKHKPPMPDRPNLKQFGHLMPDDLVTHPVWVSCHSVDYDEPWYDDTDEETFRPWLSEIPVAADEMYLVACEFTMADGSRHQGFATPSFEPDDMGLIQPQIFSPSGRRHTFWLGMFPRQEQINAFYTDFAKGPSSVFPVTFSALPGLTTAFCSGTLRGFMATSGDEVRVIT
jgi:hypothetical protein